MEHLFEQSNYFQEMDDCRDTCAGKCIQGCGKVCEGGCKNACTGCQGWLSVF